VLHGPAVLLFGSQAIGGAVNALDRRIPREIPERPFHIDVLGVYGSAADERSIGGSIDIPFGEKGFALHLDGSYRKTDDLRSGGFVLSPGLRAEQLEIAEEEAEEGHAEEAAEARELAGLRGKIPNSATEQKTLAGGFAIIRGGGSLGVSVSWFDSDYGIPSRPGAEHHHEEEEGEDAEAAEEEEEEGHGAEAVTIGLEQIRADLRGELELGDGFIDKLRVRLGAASYEHIEFEGEEVGTVFENDGFEGRLELAQSERNGWRGVTGAQFFNRDFAAVGAEAFLAPNTTSQFGIFTLQEFDLGAFGLEAAARYERTNVGLDGGEDRRFNAFSVALGGSLELAPDLKAGVNVSRAERAPAAEELFSNGPHIATQAFEIGDPTLSKERSWGGELYVRGEAGGARFSASAFYNRFDDYIFQTATGEEEDELPVFQYFQRDATYYGFEGEASFPLFRVGAFRIVGDVVGDYVRASIRGGGPVPQIPPLRLLGGVEAQSANLDARVEAEWIDDQNRVAAFETSTEGFTLVNASLAWRPFGRSRNVALVLSASNIFDVEARRHASFTKDFVPLAGRDIRVSARLSF